MQVRFQKLKKIVCIIFVVVARTPIFASCSEHLPAFCEKVCFACSNWACSCSTSLRVFPIFSRSCWNSKFRSNNLNFWGTCWLTAMALPGSAPSEGCGRFVSNNARLCALLCNDSWRSRSSRMHGSKYLQNFGVCVARAEAMGAKRWSLGTYGAILGCLSLKYVVRTSCWSSWVWFRFWLSILRPPFWICWVRAVS